MDAADAQAGTIGPVNARELPEISMT